MRLGGEASHVAYPVPTILAARMGPMPKIWVRVVPEACTSASMRPFRSAIFLSSVRTLAQDLRSQPPAEAGRGALGPYAAQDARCPLGRKRSRHPAGDEVPQERVEAV